MVPSNSDGFMILYGLRNVNRTHTFSVAVELSIAQSR